MAALNVRDGVPDGDVFITLADLRERLTRLKAATAAAADVILREQGSLRTWIGGKHLGHGHVAGERRKGGWHAWV